MNKVFLCGRLTKDPELSYVGTSNIALAKFTIAIDKKVPNEDKVKTDYIEIKAWREKAELCSEKLKKGNLVVIEGAISINKCKMPTGEMKKYTDIVLGSIKFAEQDPIFENEFETTSKNNVVNAKDLFEEEQLFLDIEEEKIPF
jgi:single-strand DNA-binding protein